MVDTTTADHLIKLFKAAKVLGVAGVLCGIQPAVAQTVVALGMDLGDVVTMRTLEEALKWCISENTNSRRAHAAQERRAARVALGGMSRAWPLPFESRSSSSTRT